MTTSLSQWISTLEQTYPTLVRLIAPLDNAALDFAPEPEGWSIREILAHLVDDEMYVMRTRLERIIKEDVPDLAPHDEKKWFRNRNTSRDQIDELLEDFLVQRTASLGIIKMLRESDWQREGFQPEYGRFTAEVWLSHWVEHDMTHIDQIEHNLAVYRRETVHQ